MLCVQQGVVQLLSFPGFHGGLKVLSTLSHRGPSQTAIPESNTSMQGGAVESVAPAWMASLEHAPDLLSGQQLVQSLDWLHSG